MTSVRLEVQLEPRKPILRGDQVFALRFSARFRRLLETHGHRLHHLNLMESLYVPKWQSLYDCSDVPAPHLHQLFTPAVTDQLRLQGGETKFGPLHR